MQGIAPSQSYQSDQIFLEPSTPVHHICVYQRSNPIEREYFITLVITGKLQ